MAILKIIITGLLALLLALPSPTLCYADVVADEGANHVQEAQNSKEDGESFEDQSEANKSSEPESSNGQRSNNSESSRSSSGDGAFFSVSSDSSQEEGLENGDLVDNAVTRSNGFDPSDYPAEYSDPSVNSYLGYARDDLQETINQFYALSESRELSDEENYQATLALFAWYYLGYGSPDDGIALAYTSLPNIGLPMNDKLIENIIYAFYGVPDSWGSAARNNNLAGEGLVWYVNEIRSKLITINNVLNTTNTYLDAINTRAAYIVDYQKSISSFVSALNGTVVDIRTHLNTIKSYQDAINTRLSNILDYDKKNNSFLSAINQNASDIRSFVNTSISFLTAINERVASLVDYQKTLSSSVSSILTNSSDISARLLTSISFLDAINTRMATIHDLLYDSATNRSWLQVIGDRLTAFMYQLDASQKDISSKLDPLVKDETVSTGFNTLDSHILLYLFGNNSGLPAHTEYLDNGLIYYIVQIHDDNKAFFDAALELLEYMKDRLFYIEYDLVDYGMDIEPGFNRLIEAINTKQFDIQLENAEVSINLSGVESRLDTIITMLGIAGVKDLLETFLGDFNFDVSSTLASAISLAMQNVFPFCIPAILKQCLGLMQAEAHAPVFEFDIFGALLVLDFTAQGLCDVSQVTSWFCRISFLILLFVNTKKFIFTINNRGAQDG